MHHLAAILRHDPTEPLLASGDEAIACFTRRDLLEEATGPITPIWDLPGAKRALKGQQPDGSWKGRPLLETWRQLRHLVDQYEMTRDHPAVAKATQYLLSCQTDEGDIRGMLGNQYAPYYTGAMLSLLIKAGFAHDPRIEKGMRWLLKMRQDDGGWVIGSPGVVGAAGLTWRDMASLTSDRRRETMREFDRRKPFSAAGTGMVLRAFAAHPDYRRSEPTLTAARLLASKLLKRDNWSSYGHPDNWVRFQFPFWWTNLVSALDSLSLIGLPPTEEGIRAALAWLPENQEDDGLWKESYSRIHKPAAAGKSREERLWITLAICRVMKRFCF